MTDDTSEFVGHEPCPECGSKDNLARYSDGHAYCFGCEYYEPADGEQPKRASRRRRMADFVEGEFQALSKRRLTEDTCRKFSYKVGTFKDKPVQVADYYDPSGTNVVAQKVRFANKDFVVVGSMKEAGLYGQHLWRDQGKMVVVTEGEIDALTVSQLQDNRWPVVSVPNGAQGARKSLQKQLDWLLGFETVVLFFDNDDPGKKAANECATLFPPGRVKIARMADFKDPNEALKAGKGKAVIDAIWGAKTFRPDGIVDGRELWSEITADQHVECIPYPYDGLNEVTLGQRRGELVTWTAGSGVGKSAITREIEYHLLMSGETVGVLRLEESKKRSATGLMGLYLQRPIHLDLTPWSQLPEDEQAARRAAYEATAGSGRWFCYDHFGSTDIDNLLSRVRYLVHGCGCNWIILDHLSIVVSGLEDGDERKTIDVVMTKLRSFVEETGCGMHLVSHLRRPEGNRGHEQGAVTSLSQLRGSHSIAQLSDMVIGAERDQQGDDADLTTLRVLKNRFSGRTGVAAHLRYDHDTGRLAETSPDFHDETSSAPDEDDF